MRYKIIFVLFLLLLLVLNFLFGPKKEVEKKTTTVPPEVANLNKSGRLAFYQGKYKKALALFRSAHRKAPDSTEILSNLAQVHLSLGHLKKSLSCLKQALALRPGHPPYELRKAQVLKRMVRFQEASRLVDGILKREPSFENAQLEGAVLHILMGQGEKALDLLEGEFSHKREADYLRGRAYFELGRFSMAQKEFQKEEFQKISWPQALRWLIKTKVQLGKTKEARNILERAMENTMLSARDNYLLQMEQANLYSNPIDFPKAKKIYEQAKEDLAHHALAKLRFYGLMAKGKILLLLMAQGKWEKARRGWAGIFLKGPTFFRCSSLIWQGVCLVFLGREKEAQKLWKKGLKILPPPSIPSLEISQTLLILLGQKSLYLPALGRTFQNNFHFFRGVSLWANGHHQRAKSAWKQARSFSKPGDFPNFLLWRVQRWAKNFRQKEKMRK